MTYKIEVVTLTESKSDSFLLRFCNEGGDKYILIDGGFKRDGKRSLEIINNILKQGGVIDLVILTHVDTDHVNGLLSIFESDLINNKNVKKILFNNPFIDSNVSYIEKGDTQCGYRQGNELLQAIIKKEIDISPAKQGDKFTIDNMITIDILSPTIGALEVDHRNWINTKISADFEGEYNMDELTKLKFKEDDKPQNISSIVCLIKYCEKNLLFCGDSVPSQILSAPELTSVHLDLFKIPHHGSRYNISKELLEIYPADRYLIPGNRTAYPSKYTIALLEHSNPGVYVYAPKRNWVHKNSYKSKINLNFLEYGFSTRIKI